MVPERGNGPPWKRSRGERDRSCPGDCELKSRRDSDDAKKNEDGFKCGVERPKAKCPSRINGNFYRAVVEVQKTGQHDDGLDGWSVAGEQVQGGV